MSMLLWQGCCSNKSLAGVVAPSEAKLGANALSADDTYTENELTYAAGKE